MRIATYRKMRNGMLISYTIAQDLTCVVRDCEGMLAVCGYDDSVMGDRLYYLECLRKWRHRYHLIQPGDLHLIRAAVGRWDKSLLSD